MCESTHPCRKGITHWYRFPQLVLTFHILPSGKKLIPSLPTPTHIRQKKERSYVLLGLIENTLEFKYPTRSFASLWCSIWRIDAAQLKKKNLNHVKPSRQNQSHLTNPPSGPIMQVRQVSTGPSTRASRVTFWSKCQPLRRGITIERLAGLKLIKGIWKCYFSTSFG